MLYSNTAQPQSYIQGRRYSRRDFLKYGGMFLTMAALKPQLRLADPGTSGTNGPPLRYLAEKIIGPYGKPFHIGIYLEDGDWNDPTGTPEQLAVQQFNHLVNHSITMYTSYAGPDQWRFSEADWLLQKAQSANQSMIGMHLVWGSTQPGATPHWITNGGYTRDQLITIIQNHIAAVMTRYKGKIGAYTVVNEALYNDWWYQQIGIDYIRIAFQKARQVDPSAVLIYNHFSNETKQGANYNTTKEHVDSLKSQGLVDAVGVQAHLWSDGYSKGDVIEAMQSYGLPVWVTEFDSYQNSVANPEEDQAQRTKNMIEAALQSGVCDHFTNWGVSDKSSYWGANWKACLWNANNSAKLNYYAIQQALGNAITLSNDVFLPSMINQESGMESSLRHCRPSQAVPLLRAVFSQRRMRR